MYIMCVILCLFRALSRMVGALQISIIIFAIINNNNKIPQNQKSLWVFSFLILFH